jgi:type II secretory pathway component GspD/PulD (secretin)
MRERVPCRLSRPALLATGLLALLMLPAWTLGQSAADAEREEKLRQLEDKVKALLKDVESLRKTGPAVRTPRKSPTTRAPRRGGPAVKVPIRPMIGAPGGAVKRFTFAISAKPWREVFKWLTDVSGKPVISSAFPTGTCTIETPPGKQYTLPEIIDLINEALLSGSATQKYLLINRERSFALVPADEKIDPALLPRVRLDELALRGNTEIVSVVVPLRSVSAEDAAPEVKKLLGPFGNVVALARANQLVLVDTVGNLRRIGRLLIDIDQDTTARTATFTYTCKYIRATEAARVLREMLGVPDKSPPGAGRPGPMGAAPPKAPTLAIGIDSRTNTLLLTGTPAKVIEVKEILTRIDVAAPGRGPILTGSPVLKMYTVPAGTAEALAKMLQDVYKSSPSCRISAAGSNKLLVHASPHDQIEIARQVLSLGEEEGGRGPARRGRTEEKGSSPKRKGP